MWHFDLLFVLTIAVLAASITHFLNYCIGKPGSEKFSPYEIFSNYTVWLSIRRLQKVDLYQQYADQYMENIDRAKTKHEILSMKNDFKKMLYDAADPFFTWERAIGMCPVCNGVWVTIFTSLFFSWNILEIIGIIVTSHILIRILSKII